MLRSPDSKYEFDKRSYGLLKLKMFKDEEFKIVGITEGRGRLARHVGAFICETKDGQKFRVKLEGSQGFLRECFKKHSLWKGKNMQVLYQDLTDRGVPRFPVGKQIREDLYDI